MSWRQVTATLLTLLGVRFEPFGGDFETLASLITDIENLPWLPIQGGRW